MFETAEVGHTIDREEFAQEELNLRARLLDAQRALRHAGFPLIVIVSGIEAAGKSEVVNRLTGWLDTRGVQTVAFWDETSEERDRPNYWHFLRRLPPRGTVGILFDAWYARPIMRRAFKESSHEQFAAELGQIAQTERMLTDDGALVVKLWFHLSKKCQKKRLKEKMQSRELTPYEKLAVKLYEPFVKAAEIALQTTDGAAAPWHVIEATHPRYRDLMAGRVLLQALERHLHRRTAPPPKAAREPEVGERRRVLDTVDLGATLSQASYEKRLAHEQSRLNALGWKAHHDRHSVVVLFEGWDAAGKGGAIRRVTASLDARLFRVVPVAAPTDEELAQHYLWRFWRHLPSPGYFTIYDRSWYGRVLVERVEGFATPDQWGRAYSEINAFEQQLLDYGICVVKFWLHISREEQLRRFNERKKIAYKQHKITEEDWRNRKRWNAYDRAVDEMVARTSTSGAPWHLIAANCKRNARVEIIKTIGDSLEQALAAGPRERRHGYDRRSGDRRAG
ncbi:MAG: polyphosphate:AMP phosphotransferase [Nevskia sp.]|nr:polyphosphate:AMP phosphotransferase [Nevskia sp.]